MSTNYNEMSTNYNGEQEKATGTIPVRSGRGHSARLKFDGCLWRAECSAAVCSSECCVDVCVDVCVWMCVRGETPCAYLPISRIPLTRGEGMAKLKLRTQHKSRLLTNPWRWNRNRFTDNQWSTL